MPPPLFSFSNPKPLHPSVIPCVEREETLVMFKAPVQKMPKFEVSVTTLQRVVGEESY